MSWAGKVKVYAPDGWHHMMTFDTESVIVFFGAVLRCPVTFRNNKDEDIITTSLPFMIDCPPDSDNLSHKKLEPAGEAELISGIGRVTRRFVYAAHHCVQGFQYYVLPNGHRVITSFPVINRPKSVEQIEKDAIVEPLEDGELPKLGGELRKDKSGTWVARCFGCGCTIRCISHPRPKTLVEALDRLKSKKWKEDHKGHFWCQTCHEKTASLALWTRREFS